MRYILMHREKPTAEIEIDELSNITNVYDVLLSIIKDAPVQGKFLFLHYKKRRYHCSNCNHHFNEPFNLLPKNCRITNRLCILSIHQLREVQNISSVAR